MGGLVQEIQQLLMLVIILSVTTDSIGVLGE